MSDTPLAHHQATPRELSERLAAERLGTPFLVFREEAGAQRILHLTNERDRLSLGRSPECDIALLWDAQASGLHAELEHVGSQWLVVDDGLSSNGTYVSGERVVGRRRLADGDVLRLGGTLLVFRNPGHRVVATTDLSDLQDAATSITVAQRRVLIALCRPFKGGAQDATPATNPQIAGELFITVAAVKTHLRALFHAFGIDGLPQQAKRRRLVALAISTGAVRDREL